MLPTYFPRRFSSFLLCTALLTGALGLLGAGCSRPEPLRIGAAEIPFEVVEGAYLSMVQSFVIEGQDTIRRSLLMNGLGAGALLHHRFPEQSTAAFKAAEAVASRLKAGSSFEEELERHSEEGEKMQKEGLPKPPTPSALGAAVCAAAASMEPGDWTGPLQTGFGWELILLAERVESTRNRAPVTLYRIQFPVGAPSDRQQAVADWSTLPLSGNAELLDCLSVEFRRNRTAPQAPQ